jgi:hypothetical protein
MIHHADHHFGVDDVLRVNRALLLSLLWAALLACVISSAVFDIGHWFHAW